MDQHTGADGRDWFAAGIRALYFSEDGSPPLVPAGILPSLGRKGAPAEELKVRRRMHDQLKPRAWASVAAKAELLEAGIPLLPGEDGGFSIDPNVPRESEVAAAAVRAANARALGALYGLTEGSTALVPRGVLPSARGGKDAPAEEKKARQRMHDLLKPKARVSDEEEVVLLEAGIPLLPRKGGGFHIDPNVPRESEAAAAAVRSENVSAIRALYGLTEGSTALVPRGVLPTWSGEGASAGEEKARQRMNNLLKPEYQVSDVEEVVLREAGIPLLPRKGGGFHIDPKVPRESEAAAAAVRSENVSAIRALYGLTEGSTALVPRGVLPTRAREGAPESEARALRRMYHLLSPEYRVSDVEEVVLRDAGIPLLPREDGGFYINPGVERQSDEAAAMARFKSASDIAALYGLTEGSTALVPRGVLPAWGREGAPEGEEKARQRMHSLLKPENRASPAEEAVLRDAGIPLLPREGGGFYINPDVARESGVKRAGSSAVPALPPGTGMPRTQNSVPLGQGDYADPAQLWQPGFPEAQSGFAEGLSGGSGNGSVDTVSGVSGVSWSAPVNPAGSYAGGHPSGAGHAPAVTNRDTDMLVSGQPVTSAAGAYLSQGLPGALGTRAREDNEQPVRGTSADSPKRLRRR
ncbi:hypothetical protein ACJ6WF_18715 [Streptomyces sp. MMS24-I2-30]|uniref:hypothetical protein n=1 Tax=Streptomyces sp. MMS24-I2-30 TaxID=3351564 RepID=UPI003896B7BA